MLIQLNGIVGGNAPIAVGARKTVLLQQIVIRVKNRQKLVLKNLNFLFNNEAFAIKIEAEPSPGVFIARGGSGDLSPNKVLVNNTTGSEVTIFLLISAVNTANNTRSLSRSDSWRLLLQRK
ncbi:hypothetical protein [Paenibacillus aceris]|uniref:Uncharacterized protein n=1 Tax=Paenibacillus aceris TaxID=869555 RepID=A0ABS4HXH9_9BACL|nr:hypothetical protein [Paenibacillus aceris]MBP1963362.1 hypothetical protein [Paenibacillus aceris]NHW36131.1 hypothetical protein [Paenibacillus aceris]